MSSDDESDFESDEEEEEDNEDEDQQDETPNLKTTKKVPRDIELDDEIFHVAFHPTKNVIACAEITGKVSIHSYSTDENHQLCENTGHTKACRNVSFSSNGERLYSSSKDKSIQVLDLHTGTVVNKLEKAHEKAVNCLTICSNCFLSGSDDGVVKMWDTRTFSSVAEFPDFKDFISDMKCSKDEKTLLCTSGDGVLSVINLRKKELEHASDQLEEELLSLVILKNGAKVACGSGEGVLNIYNWGEWGDISDRVPMEKDSIDSISALSEDIVVTGVGNGRIKSWHVLPHKPLGVLGTHGNLGIQSLSVSHDGELLASAAGEKNVKFWDVSELGHGVDPSPHEKSRKRKLDNGDERNDFFDDL